MIFNGSTYSINTAIAPTNCFLDSSVNQYIACDPSCSTCSGPSKLDCIACSTGLMLINRECILDCSSVGSNYYYDFLTKSCQPCTTGCASCFGNISTKCWSCSTGYVLSGSKCSPTVIPTCTSGTYFETNLNSCQPCTSNCISCTSTSSCMACDSITFLSPSFINCLPTCPPGYYPNFFNNKCEKCFLNCSICSNNLSC